MTLANIGIVGSGAMGRGIAEASALAGFHTVLVLSGGTRLDDLPRYGYRPETIVPSLAEFAETLAKTQWLPSWLPANAVHRRQEPRTRILVS